MIGTRRSYQQQRQPERTPGPEQSGAGAASSSSHWEGAPRQIMENPPAPPTPNVPTTRIEDDASVRPPVYTDVRRGNALTRSGPLPDLPVETRGGPYQQNMGSGKGNTGDPQGSNAWSNYQGGNNGGGHRQGGGKGNWQDRSRNNWQGGRDSWQGGWQAGGRQWNSSSRDYWLRGTQTEEQPEVQPFRVDNPGPIWDGSNER